MHAITTPSAEIATTEVTAAGAVGDPAAVPRAGAARAAARQHDALRRLRRIAVVVFGLQLLVMMLWSYLLYQRYSLTTDFAGEEQSWFMMAHGHLNPVAGAWGDSVFLRNHAEVITYLLVPLYWIWHSGVTLLWVQDAAAVGAAFVAFIWIVEVVEAGLGRAAVDSPSGQWRRRWHTSPKAARLAALGLVLLVVNPWVLWTVSFDYHVQTVATFFAILAAFDLAHGRRRAWLWIALTLACGDVAATFVFGVGLSAVLAGRATRRAGGVLMLLALGFVALLTAVGANLGSGLSIYAPRSIVGAAAAKAAAAGGTQTLLTVARSLITKPLSYLTLMWGNALNIYANLSPSGVIGIGSAWGFGVPLVLLISNDLRTGASTSLTSFQNFPIYPFLTLGTVTVLGAVAGRRPVLTWVIAFALLANVLVWSAIWLPKVEPQWLKVPSATAATLASVAQRIPTGDEVITSQGITGPLPDRESFFMLFNSVPVQRRHVWFVVAPEEGIEVQPAYEAMGQLAYLVGQLHGRLVTAANGVFAVRVTAPPGVGTITLPTRCSAIPAWASPSGAGHPSLSGPVSGWGMRSDGRHGYLVYGGYLRVSPGAFVAVVTMKSAGPVTVEVWDADRSLLLARRETPPTHGKAAVEVPFSAVSQIARPSTAGSGIWRVTPLPQPPHDQVEIRVYTPGSEAIVYTTQIVAAPPAGGSLRLTTTTAC